MKTPLHYIIRSLAIALPVYLAPVYALDTDRDGISDAREAELGTNYRRADSDFGGVHDGWEIENGFNPRNGNDDANLPPDLDSDNDGIGDHAEGGVYFDMDSDQDGLPDTIEAGFPDENRDGFLDDLTDTNNNGMPDMAEALAVSGDYPDFDNDGKADYEDGDADNDGVPDIQEYGAHLLPADFPDDPWDVDGDGILNGHEVDADGDGKLDVDEYKVESYYGRLANDIDNDGIPNLLDADDSAPYIPVDRDLKLGSNDMDHDGLTNAEEEELGTDPRRSDTDRGGVLDGWEVANGFDPSNASDDADIPVDLDIDNDGVLNEFEGRYVKDADSDGDGASDAVEIGLVDANNDGFLDDLSDINNNGMPDVAEPLAILGAYEDFDNDGIANHLDLDSDNDGVHDRLEYDTSWVPPGYTGNPYDIDGDGKPNAMDYDSDGDGKTDFEEQQVGASKSQNGPVMDGLGRVYQIGDDDGDGVPNFADANGDANADSDGDDIRNVMDVDRPRTQWNRQDDCVLYHCYLLPWEDSDGDGISDEQDWDANDDGALDFTDSATLMDTSDNDGIPAMFDDDDQVAYVAPEPEIITVEEPADSTNNTDNESEPVAEVSNENAAEGAEITNVIDNEEQENTAENTAEASSESAPDTTDATSTPESGAANASSDNGGSSSVFWILFLAMCVVHRRFLLPVYRLR